MFVGTNFVLNWRKIAIIIWWFCCIICIIISCCWRQSCPVALSHDSMNSNVWEKSSDGGLFLKHLFALVCARHFVTTETSKVEDSFLPNNDFPPDDACLPSVSSLFFSNLVSVDSAACNCSNFSNSVSVDDVVYVCNIFSTPVTPSASSEEFFLLFFRQWCELLYLLVGAFFAWCPYKWGK